jgi:hypothetical protein
LFAKLLYAGIENGPKFARQHPLSCLLLGILYTYPGGLLANCLLAKPLLSFLLVSNMLYATLLSWYLVFYSPQDLFYRQADNFYVLKCYVRIRVDLKRFFGSESGAQSFGSESGTLFCVFLVKILTGTGTDLTKSWV